MEIKAVIGKREKKKANETEEEGTGGITEGGRKGRSVTPVNAVHSKNAVFSNCLHTILIISTPSKCHESAHITMSINTKREIEEDERKRGMKESDNSLLIN